MGKVIAKKISGMNLLAKVALTVLVTFTLSVFMYEGWYTPVDVQALNSPIMHDSNNTSTTYGTWGTTKNCTWCHSTATTNVKMVLQNITTPTGRRPVLFTRMTASTNAIQGIFGNDERTYALNGSTNVCEVCHHKTKYHQYSNSKIATKNNPAHPYNRKDCTICHDHSKGFKAGCNTCHGFPPTVTTLGGPNGLASPATLALGASPANPGAHAAHDTLGMLCATCHNNYATGGHPSTSIQIDFAMNNTNWPGKFAGTAAFGTFSGNAPTGGSPAVASGTTLVRTTANNTNNSCNVYCHGNWTGSNRNTNPRWGGGASQSNCGTCHGYNNTQTPQTGSHTVHANNGTGNYRFNCSKCHATVASGADGHVNGSVQWRLSTSSTLLGANASYKGSASGQTSNVALGTAFGDCANIYCHSNGLDVSPTYVSALTWGNAAEGNCGTCHGVLAATPPASPAHAKHVATAGGYLYACATCHYNMVSVTPNSTTAAAITQTTAHVNRVHDAYAAANFNLAVVGATATTCQTTYCHSQGTGGTSQSGEPRAILAGATNPTWVSAASCAMCHTGGTTTGPSYASGSPKANSHNAHTKAGVAYTCDVCHYGTTTTGTTITNAKRHVNKFYNVSANTTKTGAFQYNYVSTGGSCANTRCHGPQTMTWGANTTDAQCTKCHGKPTTVANYSSSSNRQAAPGYGVTGTDLAGQSGTYTNGVSNDPNVGSHDAHLRSINNYTGRDVLCTDCHKIPTVITESTHMDGSPADLTWSNLAKNVGTSGGKLQARTTPLAPSYAGGGGACSNTYCHGAVLAEGANKAPLWNQTNYLVAYAKTTANCGQCHGAPPTTGVLSSYTHGGYTIASICNGCHGHEGNGPTHINGILEASGDCNTCHDYDTRNGGGTWGLGSEYTAGGWGAHAVHINYIKKRWGINNLAPATDVYGTGTAAAVCGMCHSNNEAVDHTISNPAGGRNINLGATAYPRKFGTNNPIFNTVPRTCSNLDCHYLTTPAWQ